MEESHQPNRLLINWRNPLDLIGVLIALAFIVQIFVSYSLWAPTARLYPRLPIWEGFSLPTNIHWAVFVLFLVALGTTAFLNLKRWTIPLFLIISLLYFAEDALCLQAWSYHYFAILFLLWVAKQWPNQESKVLGLMRVIIVGTYFWTGFHKINLHFVEEVFPWLMSILPLTRGLEEWTSLGYVLAVFELLLGLGLCWRRSRLPTIYLISLFHIGVLVLLIVDAWNYVVYTWNISMILLVWILFHPKKVKNQAFEFNSLKKYLLSYVIAFLFLIAPGLQIVGLWPYDLSMMMYTGLSTELEIEVSPNLVQSQKIWDCIPKSIAAEFYKTESGYQLYTDDWTMRKLNVATASSPSYQKEIAKQLCDCLGGGLQYKILRKKRWEKIEEHPVGNCDDFEY